MPINSSIALGFRPTTEIESPVNQLAKVLQVQGMQQQQDTYQRGLADESQLRELTRQSGGDMNKLRDLAYGAGNYKQGALVDKTLAEQRKAAGDLAETQAKTRKTTLEGSNLALTQHRAMLNNVNDPQAAKQWLTAAYQHPDTKEIFERLGPLEVALQRFDQNVRDPASFNKWKMGASMNADEMVKYTTPDANATLQATTSTDNNKRTVAAARDNAQAMRDAAKTTADGAREAAGIKDKRDTEMKLGDDARAQSKTFKETADAYRTIEASLKHSTTSAAATLAGATKFMKLLDPGSVVRESELGMALAATGVLDRLGNYMNTLKHGKVLTADQAADFQSVADQIYAAAQKQQQAIDGNYTKQAETYGLRPGMIVQDLGQNTPIPVRSNGKPKDGKGAAPNPQIDALLDKYK